MSDLISREKAIEDLQNGDPSELYDIEDIKYWLKSLPSAEPKTPSNGSITCVKSEKMHDRTMGDLISRQDVLHELDGCDYELKDWQRWKLKTMVRDIPSAEKAQLSEEDATSDLISRKKAMDVIRTLQTYKLFEGDDMILVDKADVQTELMMLPSAEPERKLELHGDESAIEILSELRSWFSCFDEKEGLAYHALSLAIRAIKANSIVQAETGKIIRCKDCKYFHYDKPYVVYDIPVLGHEVCDKWGDGCKTSENGFCFMAERRGEEDVPKSIT